MQQELFEVNRIEDRVLITSMGSRIPDVYAQNQEEKVLDPIQLAQRFLDVPYLWGGKTFAGVDCSGLVQVVFSCVDVQLPRDAWQQQKEGSAVRFEDIQRGDLVFFEKDFKVTHVGIADGEGGIIHAHGHVRHDQLDRKGIINESGSLTHSYHSARRVR